MKPLEFSTFAHGFKRPGGKTLVFTAVMVLPLLAVHAKSPVFRSLELYTGASTAFPLSAFNADAGAALNLSHARFMLSLAETVDFAAPQESAPQLKRWGIRLNVPIKGMPFSAEVLAGTLLFSGMRSRFNSPSLTVPQALHREGGLRTGIQASLPSFTSAEKPPSAALILRPVLSTVSFPQVEAAATGQAFMSMTMPFRTPFTNSATISLCAGTFTLSSPGGTEWYTMRPWFPEQRGSAASATLLFSTRHINSSTEAALHKNPRGTVCAWARTQGSLLLGSFTLNAAAFCAQPGLVTASSSENHVLLQLQLNPQCEFLMAGGIVQAGMLAHAEQMEDGTGSTYRRFTLRAGTRFIQAKNSAQMQAMARYSTLTSRYEWSYRTQLCVQGKNFSQTGTLAIKSAASSAASPVVTLSQGTRFLGGPLSLVVKTASASMDFTQDSQNGFFTPQSISGSITARTGGKRVKWNAKAAVSLTF